MTEETIYFYGLDLKHMFLKNIWDESGGPDESCSLIFHLSPWKVCRQVHNPACWKHSFWVWSLRSMGIAVTCNYFTVTCEKHPSSASSCREPSLSPASRCSWIPCSSQLSETGRSLVDLSPLINSGCDLQGPEAEEAQLEFSQPEEHVLKLV